MAGINNSLFNYVYTKDQCKMFAQVVIYVPAMKSNYKVLELQLIWVSGIDCLCQGHFALESEMSYLKTVKAFVNFT